MALLLDVRVLAGIAVGLSIVAVVMTRTPEWTLPGLAALGILVARPSAIGEPVPWLGPVVITGVAGLTVVEALRHRTRDRGVVPWPFVLFGLAWIWLVVHRLLNPAAEPTLGTSSLTVLLPVLAAYPLVRDRELLHRVRSALVAIVAVASGLTVVAMLIILVVGPTATSLGLVPLGYSGGSGLYLPGALSYGLEDGALLPRMLVLGREPGMGALVVGWAYFAVPPTFRRARLVRGVLLLALLGTQSTAGVGLFGVCFMLQAVLGRRRFSPVAASVAVLAGGAAVALALFDPSFGLLAKVDSTGVSFSDRNRATLDGLTALVTHPFTTASTAPLSSVNLVAAIAVNGLPWALLGAAVLLAPVLRARRRDPLRYGSLYVLLIVLTSQPLLGNTGILLLAVISFYAAERRAAAHREPRAGTVPAGPAAAPAAAPAMAAVPEPAR